MNLVAIRDFANVPILGLTVDPSNSKMTADAVLKGCRFAVGKSTDYDGLTQPEKTIVQQLVGHQAAIYDVKENAGKIERLDAAVKKEADKAAADAKRFEAASELNFNKLVDKLVDRLGPVKAGAGQ